MSFRQILAAFVAVDFAALTAWALYQDGAQMLQHVVANPTTILLTVDLVLALAVAAGWMAVDARRRGVSPLPYLVATVTLGSLGPLAYLALRPDAEHADAPMPHVVPPGVGRPGPAATHG